MNRTRILITALALLATPFQASASTLSASLAGNETITYAVPLLKIFTGQWSNWLIIIHIMIAIIVVAISFFAFKDMRKRTKLNIRMIDFIQAIYDLQKPISLVKEPLEELADDESLSEIHQNKVRLALWSASTIQKKMNELVEQKDTDEFLQAILNNNTRKGKESNAALKQKIGMFKQQKEEELLVTNERLQLRELQVDHLFMEKMMVILKKHLDDSEFTVDTLCVQMGMSRTSLYHRVKAISGQPPADFIRLYRLERARELLVSREYTVTEVAYKTGFSDVKYFRTVFRKQFNTNPGSFSRILE
jgi:AraC-like DNA-binding protein